MIFKNCAKLVLATCFISCLFPVSAASQTKAEFLESALGSKENLSAPDPRSPLTYFQIGLYRAPQGTTCLEALRLSTGVWIDQKVSLLGASGVYQNQAIPVVLPQTCALRFVAKRTPHTPTLIFGQSVEQVLRHADPALTGGMQLEEGQSVSLVFDPKAPIISIPFAAYFQADEYAGSELILTQSN